jgi:hypothetical protein
MKNLLTAILMTIVTTILFLLIYPLAVTGIAQLALPQKANGQLIRRSDRIMQELVRRRSPESLLAKLKAEGQAPLHVYIGAAAGVGKTFRMLEEAHDFRRQGVDVVLAVIEPHDRIDT